MIFFLYCFFVYDDYFVFYLVFFCLELSFFDFMFEGFRFEVLFVFINLNLLYVGIIVFVMVVGFGFFCILI